MNKKLFVLFIKYMPVILLISCSIKIYIRSITNTPVTCINYINVFLNLIMLYMVYIQGKEFNFCYLHNSICRITGWGYMYYIAFLVFQPSKETVHYIIIVYLIFSITILILYEILRKHSTNNRDN